MPGGDKLGSWGKAGHGGAPGGTQCIQTKGPCLSFPEDKHKATAADAASTSTRMIGRGFLRSPSPNPEPQLGADGCLPTSSPDPWQKAKCQ